MQLRFLDIVEPDRHPAIVRRYQHPWVANQRCQSLRDLAVRSVCQQVAARFAAALLLATKESQKITCHLGEARGDGAGFVQEQSFARTTRQLCFDPPD